MVPLGLYDSRIAIQYSKTLFNTNALPKPFKSSQTLSKLTEKLELQRQEFSHRSPKVIGELEIQSGKVINGNVQRY